jgi:hypothetical protein
MFMNLGIGSCTATLKAVHPSWDAPGYRLAERSSSPGGTGIPPADIGTELSIKFNDRPERLGSVLIDPPYEVRVTLLEIVRGDTKWARLARLKYALEYNDPPDPGFEYLLAKIRFQYLKGSHPDAKYGLSAYEFAAVSSDGKEYSDTFKGKAVCGGSYMNKGTE